MRLQRRINRMKSLLPSAAVAAALAFTAPAWAQPTPGQGGFGPKASGGANIPPSTPPAAVPPPAGPAPYAMPESTSAMPPSHRPARHATTSRTAAHHRGTGAQPIGSTADQLNQQELSRLQAGNPSMPAPPPAPGAASFPPPSWTAPGGPPYPGSPGPKSSGHGG
jgi:hypothetical protein